MSSPVNGLIGSGIASWMKAGAPPLSAFHISTRWGSDIVPVSF